MLLSFRAPPSRLSWPGRLRRPALALAVAALAACGGDDGGDAGGGGDGGGEPPPAYVVGGTLGGMLPGDTVTLLNRGGDPLVVDANGRFRFATPVTGAYDVTIGTQPSWQACTVAGGSGTATAEVQDIAVSCQRTGTVSTVAAGLSAPVTAAVDSVGNLYVTEYAGARRLVLVTPLGFVAPVATLPGSGVAVALGPNGSFYVTTGGNVILQVDPGGAVSTYAGTGVDGDADGPRASATFRGVYGLAFDRDGNMYVADFEGNRIRRITPSGTVTTLAGSGVAGSADGVGTAASFNLPSAVAVDAHGNVFVADSANHRIRRITPAGVVSTFAGSGADRTENGAGAAASFNLPFGLALGPDGYLIVTEAIGNAVRRVSPAGMVHTLAGTGDPSSNDGPVGTATFNAPTGAVLDAAGNLYIVENNGDRVRVIRR